MNPATSRTQCCLGAYTALPSARRRTQCYYRFSITTGIALSPKTRAYNHVEQQNQADEPDLVSDCLAGLQLPKQVQSLGIYGTIPEILSCLINEYRSAIVQVRLFMARSVAVETTLCSCLREGCLHVMTCRCSNSMCITTELTRLIAAMPVAPGTAHELAPPQGLRVAKSLAPPGAGKSTGLPLALLAANAEWLQGKKIVMLQPRRMAASAVARRMASLLGEQVGRTVGYTTKLERRTSVDTRIEVVTDGVLVRRLQNDRSLSNTAAVILDEFHERSIQGDLALAFLLDTSVKQRPDLRLLVMSATLNAQLIDSLSQHISHHRQLPRPVPVINWFVSPHPVAIQYLKQSPPTRAREFDSFMVGLVREVLQACGGNVVVFMAGAAEIIALCRALKAGLEDDVDVFQLFGGLDVAEQEAALNWSEGDKQRVIVATNIAESSLTVPGVRGVIDLGRSRKVVLNPDNGLETLATGPISQASADQRAGRAGRLSPGLCVRCWPQAEHASRPVADAPELLVRDSLGPALELLLWGDAHAQRLPLLDRIPAERLARSQRMLLDMGAVEALEGGALAPTGVAAAMAALPLNPRLAHLVLRAAECGYLELGCMLASLLEERDVLRRTSAQPISPDIASRLLFLQHLLDTDTPAEEIDPQEVLGEEAGRCQLDVPAVRAVLRQYRDIKSRLGRVHRSLRDLRAASTGSSDLSDSSDLDSSPVHEVEVQVAGEGGGEMPLGDVIGYLVACAFPDRLATRVPQPPGVKEAVFRLRDGLVVVSDYMGDSLAEADTIVCVNVYTPKQATAKQPQPAGKKGARGSQNSLGAARAAKKVALCSIVKPEALLQLLPHLFQHETVARCSNRTQVVELIDEFVVRGKGQLIVCSVSKPYTGPDTDEMREKVAMALMNEFESDPEVLRWTPTATEAAISLIKTFPRPKEQISKKNAIRVLQASAELWLLPHIRGMRSREELQSLDLVAIMNASTHIDFAPYLQRPGKKPLP